MSKLHYIIIILLVLVFAFIFVLIEYSSEYTNYIGYDSLLVTNMTLNNCIDSIDREYRKKDSIAFLNYSYLIESNINKSLVVIGYDTIGYTPCYYLPNKLEKKLITVISNNKRESQVIDFSKNKKIFFKFK